MVLLRLVQQCVEGERERAGTVLMDAPAHSSVEELLELAEDKQLWNGMCNALCPGTTRRKKSKTNRTKVIVYEEDSAKYRNEIRKDMLLEDD